VSAMNFAMATIDVFDRTFAKVTGAFTDPNLPKGFAPLNIQALNGTLFVTYARTDGGLGGLVDKFTTGGQLIARLVSRGPLRAPYAGDRACVVWCACRRISRGQSRRWHHRFVRPDDRSVVGHADRSGRQYSTIPGL